MKNFQTFLANTIYAQTYVNRVRTTEYICEFECNFGYLNVAGSRRYITLHLPVVVIVDRWTSRGSNVSPSFS